MDIQQKLAVNQETVVKATAQAIWDKMATGDGMKNWLGPSEYEAKAGGKIVFNVNEGDTRYVMFGEVVTYDPPNELAFTWTEQTVGGRTWDASTLVTITLTPENEGTRVRLVHSGFEQLPADIAQKEYEGYVHGWEIRKVLDYLKSTVEEN
jgi:uncharacterized protein YndB with AHSA1/START domain